MPMHEPAKPLSPDHMISEIRQHMEAIKVQANARRRAKAAHQLLEEMRQIYEATQNPLCPWLAIRYCGKIGWPIPEWVTTYLTRAAEGLEKLIDRPPADLRAVAEILEFRADSKGDSPFWGFREAREAQGIFGDYVAARDQGLTQTAAINAVATQRHSTLPTVRRRLQYHAQAVLGEGADIADLEERLQKERGWLKALDPGAPT
jgi:hypothetical protein